MQSGGIDSVFEFRTNLFLFSLFGSLALAVYLFYPNHSELPPSPTMMKMMKIVHDVAINTDTELDNGSCNTMGKNARFYSCRIISYNEQVILQYLHNTHWQALPHQPYDNVYYFWDGKFKLSLEKGSHVFLAITDKK